MLASTEYHHVSYVHTLKRETVRRPPPCLFVEWRGVPRGWGLLRSHVSLRDRLERLPRRIRGSPHVRRVLQQRHLRSHHRRGKKKYTDTYKLHSDSNSIVSYVSYFVLYVYNIWFAYSIMMYLFSIIRYEVFVFFWFLYCFQYES